MKPQLATLVDETPERGRWLYELKFDGYRALAAVDGEAVRIFTRNGLDWTERYPNVAEALAGRGFDRLLLDGEILALDAEGRSDFSQLQKALESGRGLSFFIFDLLADGGKSLRDLPLEERKERLRRLLEEGESDPRAGPLFYSEHVGAEGGAPGEEMLKQLCPAGFEGLIAKRAEAPYRSGRGRSWLKIKCARDQEFIVVGWSPSQKARPFSSLLLAAREDGKLRYAGRVGSGFSARDLAQISERLQALERKMSPLDRKPAEGAISPGDLRRARWLRPDLVAQVAFAEFTRDGLVRQARFLGLREDKPAAAVEVERPVKPPRRANKPPRRQARKDSSPMDEDSVLGVKLSNPDKVLYPQQGITKRDLAGYLARAAEGMLPHLAGRPVSLVRCPEGRARTCFFQRHAGSGLPDSFKEVSVIDKRGETQRYLYLTDAKGLVAAAQMGVLEFHVWGAQASDVDKPDRMVFDLDPDEGLGFAEVRRGAEELRQVLEALDLTCFPMLTGGKGIHLVLPLARRHGWEEVKSFSKAVAERLAESEPERYVATMSKAKRKGRIFVDYLRNEHGSSAVAPYSPRAREGAPLAWPVRWEDLATLDRADAFRLADVDAGMGEDFPDVWPDYGETRQTIKAASFRALGLKT